MVVFLFRCVHAVCLCPVCILLQFLMLRLEVGSILSII